MAKVILICGKICSGKSYYATQLQKENHGIILSCDELIKDLFTQDLGIYHDDIIKKAKQYLYKKSCELVTANLNVILEFGFWNSEERHQVTTYFSSLNIPIEWHYIDIDEMQWLQNMTTRNEAIKNGLSTDYFVDEELFNKVNCLFEEPTKEEITVWYHFTPR